MLRLYSSPIFLAEPVIFDLITYKQDYTKTALRTRLTTIELEDFFLTPVYSLLHNCVYHDLNLYTVLSLFPRHII
jgi:hypothetical protein